MNLGIDFGVFILGERNEDCVARAECGDDGDRVCG